MNLDPVAAARSAERGASFNSVGSTAAAPKATAAPVLRSSAVFIKEVFLRRLPSGFPQSLPASSIDAGIDRKSPPGGAGRSIATPADGRPGGRAAKRAGR